MQFNNISTNKGLFEKNVRLFAIACTSENVIMALETFMTITAVASLRSEPSHRSEMISQLLFGELCDALEVSGDF